jgi:hypothetical protein
MQNSMRNVGAGEYRERLGPSLWLLVAAAVVAPMVALVFVQLDTTVALVIGGLIGIAVIAVFLGTAPVVSLDERMLRAGRAHIELGLVGEPTALSGEAARTARGTGLDPRSWHLIRGGIDGVVIIPILDQDDPAPAWVISSRTPERLAAAIRRARVTQRTPRR